MRQTTAFADEMEKIAGPAVALLHHKTVVERKKPLENQRLERSSDEQTAGYDKGKDTQFHQNEASNPFAKND